MSPRLNANARLAGMKARAGPSSVGIVPRTSGPNPGMGPKLKRQGVDSDGDPLLGAGG